MEKTYTITVTYETEVTTTMSADEIEEGVWCGELEIAKLANGQSVCADATDIQVIHSRRNQPNRNMDMQQMWGMKNENR